MPTEADYMKLQGKIDALISILSDKERDFADSEKIKRFVDNYAVLNALIEDNGILEFIDKVQHVKGRFDEVSGKIDGLLGVIDAESNKLINQLGAGQSAVAINIADMVMFQSSVADSYNAMVEHLAEINITGKLEEMETAVSTALGLIDDMKRQKEQINTILNKIQQEQDIISGIQETNQNQYDLIAATENMIAELEKQIENYAFYSEEFDKVYTTAVAFVKNYSAMYETLKKVADRDGKLIALMNDVLSLTAQDFADMEGIVDKVTTALSELSINTAQKLEDMIMFTDEFNAIGRALSGYKDRATAVKNACQAEIDSLNQISFTYGG